MLTSIMKKYLVLTMSVLCLAGFGCRREAQPVQTEQYLVGANYYSWYPGNWGRGCVRRLLDPEQEPLLGYYNSWDVTVIEQHIAWCSQYGVDFLTLDWWPHREEQSEYIEEAFLKARNIGDIKFCIFYETWSLNFNSDTGATTFNPEVKKKFLADMKELSGKFFNHPSYLKIDGRPVIVLYLSRTFAGDFKNALSSLRKEMKAAGFNPFIIGDEVFWKVTPIVKKGKQPHPLVEQPQADRIMCFDAIMSYNTYENEIKSHKGYGADSSYVKDVNELYDSYRKAADNKVYIVPEIIPGYNDRGGRLMSDHYVIPRQWKKGGEEGSFFAESFDRIAMKNLDHRLNMLIITSWNEWNEDTGIEPFKPAAATTRDRGSEGTGYTQGYSYYGHGMKYLEIIRDKVCVSAGRVVDQNGAPKAGVRVRLVQGDRIAESKTDSAGYYRISRLNLKAGKAECIVGDGVKSVNVELLPDRAVLTDFTFQE